MGAVISGLNQPLPLVRFQLLVQKATEICQEVKTLGSSLLSSIEKEDNEALLLLRSRHEKNILKLTKSLRYAQWQEAIQSRLSLVESLKNAVQRYIHYQQLLGKKAPDPKSLLEMDDLDVNGLKSLNFKPLSREKSNFQNITYDHAESKQGTLGDRTIGLLGADDITGGQPMNINESEELDLLESAQFWQDIASFGDTAASGLSLIPQYGAKAQPLGVGVSTGFGGVQLSKIASLGASASRGFAGRLSYEASRAARLGSYARRTQDWTFQNNLTLGEINQIIKQLEAARIREFITKRDYENHQKKSRMLKK